MFNNTAKEEGSEEKLIWAPTVEDIELNIKDHTYLVCICSPQNPTGRVIDPEVLKGICELVVTENNLRKNQEGGRPLYLFFDQIYSDITKDGLFVHPLTLCPEIRPYLVGYLDQKILLGK